MKSTHFSRQSGAHLISLEVVFNDTRVMTISRSTPHRKTGVSRNCVEYYTVSEMEPKVMLEPIKIACLGDSLTFGHPVDHDQTYPAVLQNLADVKHFGRFEVVNQDLNGMTVEWILPMLDEFLDESDPDMVMITIGGNDLFLFSLNPDSEHFVIKVFRAIMAVRKVVDQIKAYYNSKGQRPVVAIHNYHSIPFYGKEIMLFNLLLPFTGVDKIVHNWWSFLDCKTGHSHEDLISLDQIHPNARGYRLIAQNALKTVLSL